MTAFADRERRHHLWGTLALMGSKVLDKTELLVVVDGSGVPTGDIYVGDGSTAGGIIIARDASYALLDGSRSFTGLVNFDAGIMVAGSATFTGLVSLVALQQLSLAPSWLSHNYTEENIDGGRETLWRSSGEKGDGTIHNLVSVRDDHVGTGDDQKARRRVYLNDGNDGMGDGQLLYTLTGADLLALFAGEVRHPLNASASYYKSTAQTVLATAGWVVATLAQTFHTDSGFTWSGATAYELTCNFTGRVWVSYHGTAKITSGTRGDVDWRVEVDTGGGFGIVPGSLSTAYIRTTTEAGSASVADVPLDVTSGDKLRLTLDPTADVQTVPHGVHFTVKRGQGAT